jgi:hypothetical protein
MKGPIAYTVTGGRQRNKEFCAHNIFENQIMLTWLMEIISIIKERLKYKIAKLTMCKT